jgi:hypothetical protein
MAASGIGPIARIRPGGAFPGRIVGLAPLLGAVARYGPAVVELTHVAKDWNDRPTGTIVGSSEGRVVRTTPGTRWSPTATADDFGGMTEDQFAAHAQQAGRQNRALLSPHGRYAPQTAYGGWLGYSSRYE